MKKILLMLMSGAAYLANGYACSMSETQTGYELQANNIIYVSMQVGNNTPRMIASLKEIDASKFHPLGTLKQDFFNWDNTGYFSDTKHIIWQDKILVNDENLPPVDVKSFRQSSASSSFAVDEQSIYFNGQQVEENTANKRVDLNTLKVLDDYLMSDANNLYHQGKYRGTVRGYQEIARAGYGNSCFVSYYIIAKSDEYVFLNGEIIEGADPNSFRVKRWMPELLLDYEDITGSHTFTYGKTELELTHLLEKEYEYLPLGIHLLRDRVVYVKKWVPFGKPTDKRQIVEIKGLDPQRVHFLNSRAITQDGKTIYIFEGYLEPNSKNKELTMRVIHLDEPINELSDVNTLVDKRSIYFINDNKRFKSFKKEGQFIKLNSYFARDDKYVYMLAVAKRIKTHKPQAVKLKTDYYLMTAEGVYDTEGKLHSP